MEHPRAWVVSVDGIGGVGKTALAVNTAYKVREQSLAGERDFEYIIWASAKIERLTPRGIAKVLPSFSDLPSLVDVILEVTGFVDESKSETERLELVLEILGIAKCLVVLDNLETVRDTKISYFLANVPAPSKVLITTRERIEESQRNLRLTALSHEGARDLLSELGIELDASELLNAKPEELDRFIERVGGIPLAMKLAAGRLATGVPLPSYINRLESGVAQQDILEFCFDESWTDLDPDSKLVLMATTLFAEPPSEEELRRVTDLPELRVRDAIGALTRRAFLNSEDDSAHETYRYSLLPLTADFVRRQLSADTLQETQLRDNHSAYLVERGRYQEALGQTSQLLRSEGSIPDAELLSNMLVDAAFRTYQSGDYQGALSRLQNAQTYRETGYLNHTWGVIERDEGAYSRSREKFRKSVSLQKDRLPTWRSWGRMEQRLENWDQAVECFFRASELPRSDPQDFHGLGVCLSRLSGKKGAQERQSLLQQAEQALKRGFYRDPVGYRETHHNVVNSHSLALVFERLGRVKEALIQCRNGLRLEPNNERLIDLNLSLNNR
ncbi:MAG: hypothetical protein BZY87_08725 [SAR202 cluster bacterium Io17-Chloro-G6]|nr:MAG: hypothetical protein BZY87_08725 [SAR202 cluster bacterium Io17-Chloro-G6]